MSDDINVIITNETLTFDMAAGARALSAYEEAVQAGYAGTEEEYAELMNALTIDLSMKQDTLVSATNIKTVGNKSVLGAGDIGLTSNDVLDSVNKRYITDAEKSNLHAPHSDDQDLSGLVPKTTTVNNKALNGNISLDYSDVGAEPAKGANDNYVTDAEKSALHGHSNKTALDNVSGTNTGDETNATIKTKLGITTLSGSNTGDQDLSGLQSKSITDAGGYFGTDTVEGALAELGAKGNIVADQTFEAVWKTGTWTADSTTDTLTCSIDHGFAVGNVVSFGVGTGALPGGISAEPEYYFVESVPTTKTLKLKLTRTGTALDITSDGTAGWKIRSASVSTSASNPIALDLSGANEIDVYGFFDFPQYHASGNSHPVVYFSTSDARVMLNDANVYGASNAASLYSAVATKKYVKINCRINIRKIAPQLYALQIDMSGLYSDNIDLTSSTAYTRVFNGKITGADPTYTIIREAYSSSLKNGARFVVIRR